MRPPVVAVSPPVPSIQNRSSAPCPLALDSILHVIFVGISSRFDQIFHVLNGDKFVLPYLLSEKPSSVILLRFLSAL
jgi:hypothetical protein